MTDREVSIGSFRLMSSIIPLSNRYSIAVPVTLTNHGADKKNLTNFAPSNVFLGWTRCLFWNPGKKHQLPLPSISILVPCWSWVPSGRWLTWCNFLGIIIDGKIATSQRFDPLWCGLMEMWTQHRQGCYPIARFWNFNASLHLSTAWQLSKRTISQKFNGDWMSSHPSSLKKDTLLPYQCHACMDFLNSSKLFFFPWERHV